MKKMLFLLLLSLGLTGGLAAQKLKTKDVPEKVYNAFAKKFKEASKEKWEMTDDEMYLATFKLNGAKTTALYDEKGMLKETATELDPETVPSPIRKTIKTQFPDHETESASKITNAECAKCYRVILSNEDQSMEVLFKNTGEVVSKKMIEAEEDSDN